MRATRSTAFLCGAAITALAALPRFLGLEVGGVLEAAHPDELPVALAQWKLRAGEPTLHLLAYGGGYHTPLHLVLGALGALGIETVLDADPARHAREDATAICSDMRAATRPRLATAAVALVFWAGRAVAGVRCGAIAALILAAAPAAIRDAHLAKADAAATLAAALVIAALARSAKAIRAGRDRARRRLRRRDEHQVSRGTRPCGGLGIVARPASRAPYRAAGGRRLRFHGCFTAAGVVALNWFWLADPAECWKLLPRSIDTQYRYVNHPWIADASRSPLEYHAMVSLRHGCGGSRRSSPDPRSSPRSRRPGATRRSRSPSSVRSPSWR